jgi:hypothetical protein
MMHDKQEYAEKIGVCVKKNENPSERILEGNGNFDLNSVILSQK